MRIHVKILIGFITTSLLLSQLGFNIFLNYCCCAKSEVFSFIPKADHCKRLSINHGCCNGSSITKKVSIRKAACSNKVIGHKSLETLAEKPVNKQLQVQSLQIPSIPLFTNLVEIFIKDSIIPNDDPYPFITGLSLRILHCSWIC